jgi:hypothetical protein
LIILSQTSQLLLGTVNFSFAVQLDFAKPGAAMVTFTEFHVPIIQAVQYMEWMVTNPEACVYVYGIGYIL